MKKHATLPRGKYILTRIRANGGRRETWQPESFEVRLMATSEGYAMVRRPGAMPFACPIEQLSKTEFEGSGK